MSHRGPRMQQARQGIEFVFCPACKKLHKQRPIEITPLNEWAFVQQAYFDEKRKRRVYVDVTNSWDGRGCCF